MNLKTLGKAIANVTGIISGYGPLFASLTPTTKDDRIVAAVTNELGRIGDVIASVETMGAELGTPGIDKARAAGPLVAQIILRSMDAAGKKLDDGQQAKFKTACAAMSGAYADILDCFKEK